MPRARIDGQPTKGKSNTSHYSIGSPEQQAVWRELDTGNRNIVIQAVAGSGKTWTLVEWAKRITGGMKVALVAFNKHIADELKNRLGNNPCVEAMTYHSLGFKQIRSAFGKVEVDQYKVDNILDDISLPIADEWKEKLCKGKIRNLVGLARQYDVSSRGDLEYLVDHHDLELNGNEETVYEYTPIVLEKCKLLRNKIDFDDMIWFPKVFGLSTKSYDVMCVDEAQDTGLTQQYIALNSSKRLVCIGDRNQAIYQFRGADIRSMDRLKEALQNTARNCIELPLTVTRRCPRKHVELAQRIVPHIRALEGAKDGVVRVEKMDIAISQMSQGDLVLCRVNAELIGVAYKLLRRGIKAVVRGRDIGKGLEKLIDKATKAGSGDKVSEVLKFAGEITQQEIYKFLSIPKSRGEMRASSAQDKYDCLIELSEGANTVGELKSTISKLFADFDDGGKPNQAVVLGTVHRTKGLESNRVWVLRGDLIPHPMAKQEYQREAERNLGYVAVTRSLNELIWVGSQSGLFI